MTPRPTPSVPQLGRDGQPGAFRQTARPRGGWAVPRLALSVQEACEALGVGWDFWREHVAAEVRVVRRGRRKLIAVAELERWLDANAERALPDGTGRATP